MGRRDEYGGRPSNTERVMGFSRGHVLAGGAALVAAVWLGVGIATAQVPTIPAPPGTSTTVPGTRPPPEGSQPPVPDPAEPPAPPTTAAPGAPAAPAPTAPTSTTTTTKPPSTARPPASATNSAPPPPGVDLSEFAALRRAAKGKGPRPAIADPGFDPALPFRSGSGQGGGSGGDARELGAEAEDMARIRSAGAVAGGLLALVLLGIVVWVLRQAQPELSPGPGG